ncbi:unnamed protein product [Rhizoctonia solani]|uniref:Uncharacterized protein n=1 Tax=Rhizoctonia solani TaxID=456999 RepID=A0A8H3CAD4_9AGAM|nr:unnamed protein product [Rhizoctonia solani]
MFALAIILHAITFALFVFRVRDGFSGHFWVAPQGKSVPKFSDTPIKSTDVEAEASKSAQPLTVSKSASLIPNSHSRIIRPLPRRVFYNRELIGTERIEQVQIEELIQTLPSALSSSVTEGCDSSPSGVTGGGVVVESENSGESVQPTASAPMLVAPNQAVAVDFVLSSSVSTPSAPSSAPFSSLTSTLSFVLSPTLSTPILDQLTPVQEPLLVAGLEGAVNNLELAQSDFEFIPIPAKQIPASDESVSAPVETASLILNEPTPTPTPTPAPVEPALETHKESISHVAIEYSDEVPPPPGSETNFVPVEDPAPNSAETFSLLALPTPAEQILAPAHPTSTDLAIPVA